MEKADEERIAAGLCYFPFLFVNIIAIVFVLLVKKEWEYARFHALQALALYAVVFFVGSALFLLLFFPMFVAMEMVGQKGIPGDFEKGAFGAAFPPSVFGMLVALGFLAMCVMVGTGRDVRVPMISGFVDGLTRKI